MARPKKVTKVEKKVPIPVPVEAEVEAIPIIPSDLSVDYPSEGLNNMARTINEILAFLRYGQK